MRTQAEVWLNHVSLNDIDPRIIIQKITQSKPATKTTAVTLGGRVGQFVTQRERTTLDVSVQFSIAEKRDLDERARILQAVNGWAAGGGALTVNYRKDQVLTVVCDELPENGYLRAWTSTYKLTFRAYSVPYWVASTFSTASPVSGKATIFNPGTAMTPLELTATATAANAALTITDPDGKKLAFSGMTCSVGDKLTVTHDGCIMLATIGANDALQYRTADSADEIMIHSGRTELTVSGGFSVELAVKGRWH